MSEWFHGVLEVLVVDRRSLDLVRLVGLLVVFNSYLAGNTGASSGLPTPPYEVNITGDLLARHSP